MVGVQVGEEDRLDLLRRDPARAQIVRELAERRPHRVAGAGIDQRAPPAALKQEGVHRNRQRVGGLETGEPLLLVPLHAEHHVERGRQHAVAERRYGDVVDFFGHDGHDVALEAGSVGSLSPFFTGRGSAPRSRRRQRSNCHEPGGIWISSLSCASVSGAGMNLNWIASFMLSSSPKTLPVCRLSLGMKSFSMRRTAGSDRPENAM